MSDKFITYDWLITKKACYYTRKRKEELGLWLSPQLPLSAEEVSKLDIHPIDKLWVYYKLMGEDQLRLSARNNALPALQLCTVSQVVKDWILSGDEALMEKARLSMVELISLTDGATPIIKKSMKALLWSCDDDAFRSAFRSAIVISSIGGEKKDNIQKIKNDAFAILNEIN
jgi:hypothetical protein